MCSLIYHQWAKHSGAANLTEAGSVDSKWGISVVNMSAKLTNRPVDFFLLWSCSDFVCYTLEICCTCLQSTLVMQCKFIKMINLRVKIMMLFFIALIWFPNHLEALTASFCITAVAALNFWVFLGQNFIVWIQQRTYMLIKSLHIYHFVTSQMIWSNNLQITAVPGWKHQPKSILSFYTTLLTNSTERLLLSVRTFLRACLCCA